MRLWLKELRIKKGFTQNGLALLVNIDKTTISKYEQDICSPSVKIAKEIAEILEFDWRLFYSDNE